MTLSLMGLGVLAYGTVLALPLLVRTGFRPSTRKGIRCLLPDIAGKHAGHGHVWGRDVGNYLFGIVMVFLGLLLLIASVIDAAG